MSERRLVECSLRLMTPSPSWCLLRRFEKVLSSLSTFGPESTLASSFQNGSLGDIMTDLRSPEGFTVSPPGLRPSSQRYDSETKSWLTTVFSCWAAPSGAARVVARPPGEQLSRCVPRTQCTVEADAPCWAGTADRTAACYPDPAAGEYQEIRARQHLREGKKPGNTIRSHFIILLKQIHPHRLADIALLRPIWWMESCLGWRAGSVSWYHSTHMWEKHPPPPSTMRRRGAQLWVYRWVFLSR